MKQRHLIALASVTAVFIVAAVIAVMLRQSANLAAVAPSPLFPALASQLDAIAKLSIASSAQTLTVTRDAKGGWSLPDSGGWAANFDTVRKAVLALSGLRAIERRTAVAQNHAALMLLAPAAGGEAAQMGFQITASDAAGAELASVIIGKLRTPPDGNRPGVAFARRAGQDQSYLVEGDVNFPMQVSDVIDAMLFDVVAARIMSASVTPPAGPSFEVRRSDPKAEFAFAAIPKGQEPVIESLAASIAETVALLTLENAIPAKQIDFSGATRVEHRLFDGLVLNSETVKRATRRWTRFVASFDAAQAASAAKSGLLAANKELKSAAEVTAQVAAINARTGGWAFVLPGMRSADLSRDYASLFRAKAPLQSVPAPRAE